MEQFGFSRKLLYPLVKDSGIFRGSANKISEFGNSMDSGISTG